MAEPETPRESDTQGLSGRDLQASQSGGESGEFGGNRAQSQAGGIVGGGPSASDLGSAGGSSGTGGYGRSQNAANHQGQGEGQAGLAGGGAQQGDHHQSRGEAFDEQQGGGRDMASVSRDDDQAGADDPQLDQQAHQDRGQSEAEFNAEEG
jgi:hypothetical protein